MVSPEVGWTFDLTNCSAPAMGARPGDVAERSPQRQYMVPVEVWDAQTARYL